MDTLLDQTANKSELHNKCPYCGSSLQQDDHLPQEKPQKKSKWYYSTASVVISLLTVGPFALPMVWFNPRYSLVKKIAVTLLVTAITIMVCLLIVYIFNQLSQALGQLRDTISS